MKTLRTLFAKASKIFRFLPFLKPKPEPTLSDLLRAYADEGHTNPQLYKATMATVIKLRGLRGPQKNAFRQQWRRDYNWKDTHYLRDAADMLEA